jgi:Outer membrane cobalamin receptor protein
MEKALQRAKYDEDMRFVQLKEVEVVAKRIEKKEEPRLRYWANSNSDVTVRREEIEEKRLIRLEDLLSSISGVIVIDGAAYIQRAMHSSINLDTRALIILDGMIINNIDLNENVVNIESIDVFKGASAAIFGLRGNNGAISITTRRGEVYTSDYKEPNFAVLSPLGYQKPVEFYSPKYDTPNSKYLTNPDYRTTIFWKPDIVINEKEEARFEFYTSDFSSTYSVVIEGITNDGRIIRQVEKIEVK